MTQPASQPDDPAHHPLVKTTMRSLRHRCGVQEGDTLLMACSGGADSVALLRAIDMLAGRRTWQLRLIMGHVNHGLRPEADSEQAFVEDLGRRLGYSCESQHIRLEPDASGNLENDAREKRYEALIAMAEQHGASLIATAHHADDQLETMLMAILRGTTVRGLRGIARRRELRPGIHLIRPMLETTHEQAMKFLQQLGQPWQEDASNGDRDRTRARLRREVLPVLREIRSSAASKAVELADHLRDVVDRLERTDESP